MKTKNFLIASGAVLALGALTACSNDKSQEPSNDQILHFYVAGVETRTATGDINKTNIEEGNTVGIFGISSDESEVQNGSNNKYNVGTGGALTADDGEMKATERSNIDIFAYAPHQESWSDHQTSYNFTVNTNQSDIKEYIASDLLYAETTISNISSSQAAVGLTFTHKMARVILKITRAKGADDLTNAIVTVNNTKPTISFSPKNGILGEATGTRNNITALSKLGTNETVYAVVVPQTIDSETTLFTIQTSDRKFSLVLEDEVTFVSGSSYTYNVTVNPTELKDITITLTSPSTTTQVTDWNVEEGEEAEAIESQL
ncbi:MAG: fimbrillin family protein [Muribaculaceae bacterium]|nr:fimbrillin family protein [Muribaculaceae bacterium]